MFASALASHFTESLPHAALSNDHQRKRSAL
jgi:hypothetical protein